MAYVLFKGDNSQDIEGLKVVSLPSLSPPKYRINKVSTPYVEGDYIEFQEVENIIKIVEFQYEGNQMDLVKDLFYGEGVVKFSNQEDRRYRCYVTDVVIEEKVLDYIYRIVVTFDCSPYSYLESGEDVVVIDKATIFKNLGNMESRPVVTIYATGNVTLVVGQVVVNLKGIDEFITIDSMLLEAYKGGNVQNSKMIGKFPYMQRGDTSISWSGMVSKVEVIPKWRCR